MTVSVEDAMQHMERTMPAIATMEEYYPDERSYRTAIRPMSGGTAYSMAVHAMLLLNFARAKAQEDGK